MAELENGTNETLNEGANEGASGAVENTVSVEEQLAKMQVEYAKLKKAFDKTASETAAYKKQLREKMSEEERLATERAEQEQARENRIKELERENSLNKLSKQFLSIGYNEEMAEKSAIAQLDGDMDTILAVQNDFLAMKEADMKAKLLGGISAPGTNNANTKVTKEQFNKMGYSEMLKFKNENPELFAEYTKH